MLKVVQLWQLFQMSCWLCVYFKATFNAIFLFSFLFSPSQLATLTHCSHPFTHLSQPDILSRYQHFSKLLVSAIAPLLSSGLPHFLTRCTFILPAPSAGSPRAQLPSKYTQILSPAEVTLQCSQHRLYRPVRFPPYLLLHYIGKASWRTTFTWSLSEVFFGLISRVAYGEL